MTARSQTSRDGAIEVQCRHRSRRHDFALLDISHGGCMVASKYWSAEPGDRVLVKLPGFEFQAANLIWIEDTQAGIAFEELLHDIILEKIKDQIVA